MKHLVDPTVAGKGVLMRIVLRTAIFVEALLCITLAPVFASAPVPVPVPSYKIEVLSEPEKFYGDKSYSIVLLLSEETQSLASEGEHEIDVSEIRIRKLAGPIFFTQNLESSTSQETTCKVNKHGECSFFIQTQSISGNDEKFTLRIHIPDGDNDGSPMIYERVVLSSYNPLFGERLAAEILIGTTFNISYDSEGRAEGFGKSRFLGWLNADILWKKKIECREEKEEVQNRDEKRKCQDGVEKENVQKMDYSKATINFGVEMIVSSFPSRQMASEMMEEDSGVEQVDSFSGRLYFQIKPKGWYNYIENKRRKVKPFDVFRWGILGKIGAISRETQDLDGDTTIETCSLGMRLNYYTARSRHPELDTENVFPIFFVDASTAWYEEFGLNQDDIRLVINMGLRLSRNPKRIAPFYAGVHVNLGKGVDDIRAFAGFLFSIDKLPELLSAGGGVQ